MDDHLKVFKKKVKKNLNKIRMKRTSDKNISKFKNKILEGSKLKKKEKKAVKNYYSQYDIRPQTKFHALYKSVRGTFDVRFIPENVYGSEILPILNQRNHVPGMSDKNIFDKLFFGFNQPLTLIRKISGEFYNREYELISKNELRNILSTAEKVIIKPASGSRQGKGIGIFETEDVPSIIKFLDESGENLIVQEFIKQSGALQSLNPTSVQIFRVMTLRLNNEIHYLGSYLSIGRAESKIANISDNTVNVYINDHGQLSPISMDSDLNVFEGHPDYKYKFTSIPTFSEVIEFSKQLHSKVPWFDIVGWDISIDNNEDPIFIEMNASFPGVIYPQFFWGPLFGELTEEVLLKVKKRK
ncbi:hypothetical protein LQF61_07880 [Tetragenococcus koreensis]|uniref:Alpha-L-glutamate ligase-related protein ATP-grasp domain-containing protein n=1 Tax=Tetragenococcus halophilus TaxID=51669 RepID=A0AB35HRC1_TETHA|nr:MULTISPECIES: sugar-transfer associated ATP-grasp domain-containing protein [Tetragenococcus]MCF1619994.1 hypothetical protein [Tetragenococcus koreensis]MCF1657467.1 hypothetical protein [Tetragenococcus koreensis]MCO8298514.1 hypothetical protein [Tetragenococcus halophilus]